MALITISNKKKESKVAASQFGIVESHSINITPAAHARILELAVRETEPYSHFRIAVRGGGCSGFSLSFTFVNSISDKDSIFDFDNLKVAIDAKSLSLIGGSTLDFGEGKGGKIFKLHNKNFSHSCSCGASFSL